MHGRERRRAAAVLLALLALLVMSAPAVGSPQSVPQSQQVGGTQDPPRLVGLTLDAALARLADEDLASELVPEELPAGVDRGRVAVLRQAPLRDVVGTKASGWVLFLGAAVPDVVGQVLTEAFDEIAAAGLTARVVQQLDADDLAVVDQDPAAGSLLQLGDPVRLEVAPVVRVPDVVGLSRAEAADSVEGLGLVLVTSGDDGSRAVVEAQEPAPGARVPRGSPVRVRLAVVGPQLVRVPDLAGASVEQARERLVTAGLALEATVQGDEQEARAVGQTPAAGALVPAGTVVAVRFEAPLVPAEDTSPVSMSPVEALAAALGLLVATTTSVLVRRAVRRARERRWVRRHVDCRSHAGPATPPSVERPVLDVCWAVRVDVRPDAGRQELEEVPA